MSGKHTPGPWRANWAGVLDAGGNGIAICNIGNGTLDRVTANAHLIAAAPDLADVLAQYEAWEADVILNADWTHDTPRLTQQQWDELSRIQGRRIAALAKARGQA